MRFHASPKLYQLTCSEQPSVYGSKQDVLQ